MTLPQRRGRFKQRARCALRHIACFKRRACATRELTGCTGACFEAPPLLRNTAGTCLGAYLAFWAGSAGSQPASQLASQSASQPSKHPGNKLSSNDVPVVFSSFRHASNIVPVHSLICPNAQVRCLKHPLASESQTGRGLKRLRRCSGGLFLCFVRGVLTFSRQGPAQPFSAIAKRCPVLAREAEERHMMDFDYVPGVLRSFWGAPNHVPVQPVNSQNAQVHGLGHPPSSQMRQARALKPIERTFSRF